MFYVSIFLGILNFTYVFISCLLVKQNHLMVLNMIEHA